eukprot:g6652.t1
MLRNLYSGVRRSTNLVHAHGRRQFVAASTSSTKPVQEELTYTERQEKTGRPLSPHVSVYVNAGTFPTIAISSILNRATGVSLSMGLAGCGALSLMGADVPTLMYEFGHGSMAPVFKFGVAFPLVYHYAAGIRHLYWDQTVKGFSNEEMQSSSVALLLSTTIASAGIAVAL